MAAGEMNTGIVVGIPRKDDSVDPTLVSRSILGRKKYLWNAFRFS